MTQICIPVQPQFGRADFLVSHKQMVHELKFSIAIGWDLFALSTLQGLMIALATVSYNAFKIAFVNPAETLTYE